MKIKRYIARNMKEAISLIREDMGPEAVIVSSRKIREKGLKGLISPRKLEVTAAVDENGIHEESDLSSTNKVIQKKESKREKLFKQELDEIKEILKNFSLGNTAVKKQNRELNKPEIAAEIYIGDTANKNKHQEDINKKLEKDHLSKFKEFLLDKEIHPEIVEFLCEGITKNTADKKNGDTIKEIIQKRIKEIFKQANADKEDSRIMAFVGPPGVGKTTTLAKLGAIFSLYNDLKVSLITIDTYRIGAVEQLEIYGDIIGISVDVVMTPEELKIAVEKNQDKDLILIDTAGRPSRNTFQIAEIKTFLEVVQPIDIFLVLSAATKDKDIMRILNDFKILNYSRLIFTKIDETEMPGSILNAVYWTGLPVTYITNGQNVPDDIEVADNDLLARIILGDVGLSW